jgi:hypothetical protein
MKNQFSFIMLFLLNFALSYPLASSFTGVAEAENAELEGFTNKNKKLTNKSTKMDNVFLVRRGGGFSKPAKEPPQTKSQLPQKEKLPSGEEIFQTSELLVEKNTKGDVTWTTFKAKTPGSAAFNVPSEMMKERSEMPHEIIDMSNLKQFKKEEIVREHSIFGQSTFVGYHGHKTRLPIDTRGVVTGNPTDLFEILMPVDEYGIREESV